VSNAIVVCTWGAGRDGLPVGAAELLTLGRKLGAARGTSLDWLVVGPMPSGVTALAAAHGVTALQHLDHEPLADFQSDAYTEALTQYYTQQAPQALLLAQSFDARVLAPRLAARVGAGVVMNAVDLAVGDGGRLAVTASAYGGNTRAVYSVADGRACIVGVLADGLTAQPAAAATTPATQTMAVDLGGMEERVRIAARAERQGPRLEDAQIIVAGGRGLGVKENFHLVEELAAALGGMAGASRPIVDDGWTDSAHQVGLTGKMTRPTLYIAAGISGASQHMVGCAAAKTLVAINRDPDAAIFRYARYGIVGDCVEILPELTRIVRSTA